MVWKSTKYIGAWKKSKNNYTRVVAMYYPKGNVAGCYTANVLQTATKQNINIFVGCLLFLLIIIIWEYFF